MYEQIQITCKDGSIVKGLGWEIKNAVANLVIITGMQEHSRRYDELATFLNEHKVSVFCIDHYQQGENNTAPKLLGRWEKSGFTKMVKRVNELVEQLRITCRPTYLMGHSLGSFMAQDYIQRYSEHIEKVILMGTCGPMWKTKLGGFVTKVMVGKTNYNKKAVLLKKMTFGSFNKLVKHPESRFDWLSANKENVKNYIDDEKCGVDVTNGFYKEFIKGLNRLGKTKFLKKIRKDLPILLISGAEDPVGHYGKGVTKLAEIYQKQGIENVQVILNQHMRHEILFEDDKKQVYNDILNFISK